MYWTVFSAQWPIPLRMRGVDKLGVVEHGVVGRRARVRLLCVLLCVPDEEADDEADDDDRGDPEHDALKS